MKQFLVLLAVLPIMLIIMVEFSLNTMINTKVDAVNDIVYTYKELAKQRGTFNGIIQDMRSDIAGVVGVKSDEILVEGTYCEPSPKYRVTSLSGIEPGKVEESFIRYVIKVPIGEMKSLGSLLKADTKKTYYVIDSYTASERLPSEDQ